MLELHDVAKTLDGTCVLKSVSLIVNPGEICCLVGPSGAGKTTILEIAAGIARPDRGRVQMESPHIGYLFQDTPLPPWLSATRFMDLMMISSVTNAGERTAQITYWLEQLGLSAAAGKRPAEMSGGMQRRLAIAAALAIRPRILLLDEPFAFLDDDWQHRLSDLLIRESRDQGVAILMASHQLDPVRMMGAAVIEISDTVGGICIG
ncbi:MAG: hypothetical protein CSA22_03610 [Deltaproteobacteria bacterium]|nr:MAG: hypothetical protein CSA22_03610 [Deltaproteobacteria bacterium]